MKTVGRGNFYSVSISKINLQEAKLEMHLRAVNKLYAFWLQWLSITCAKKTLKPAFLWNKLEFVRR